MASNGGNSMNRVDKRKHGSVGEEKLFSTKRTKLSSPSNGGPSCPIAGRRACRDEMGESGVRPTGNSSNFRQQSLLVEQSEVPARDKFVTSAQEDLMQMIEERASDKAIENQMKIIKMLRARLSSNEGSYISCGTNYMQPATQNSREKTPNIETRKDLSQSQEAAKAVPKPRNALFMSSSPVSFPSQDTSPTGCITRSAAKAIASASSSTSASSTPSGATASEELTPTSRTTRSVTKAKEAATATSNAASNTAKPTSTPTPSGAPARRRKKRFSAAKASTSREVSELMKGARPAAAPTTLPVNQRTNRNLTASEFVQLSTVHSSFDAKTTSRFHRHERKINRTVAMASDAKPATKERSLKDRVRSPTLSSPEVLAIPAAAAAAAGMRLDAAALRAVSAASARSTSVSATTGAVELPAVSEQQPVRHGLPGQVFNQTLNRWIYVEESDSDSD